MKKWIRLVTFFTLAIPMATPLAIGADAGLRTVSTSGQGVVRVDANRAAIHMQISTINKSATSAKQTVDQTINRALSAMEKLGISKDQLVASTIRLVPSYEYSNRERIFSGYQAIRELTVTLNKLPLLDKVLESATAAGVNNVLSIQLQSSQEEELKTRARKLAIEDSKRKADELATAYGAELGNVHTIQYHSNTPIVMQEMAAGSAMLRAAPDQAGGQYLHDKIEVTDQVQVVFELLIPH